MSDREPSGSPVEPTYRIATTEQLLMYARQGKKMGDLRPDDRLRMDPEGKHVIVPGEVDPEDPDRMICSVFYKGTDKEDPHSAILHFYSADLEELPRYVGPGSFIIVAETKQGLEVLEEGITNESYALYLENEYRMAYAGTGISVRRREVHG